MRQFHTKSQNGSHRATAGILAVIFILTAITAWAGSLFVKQIRAKVRSTTVQVISELTANKADVLSNLLNETKMDLRVLADYLASGQGEDLNRELLDAFQQNQGLEALAVLDAQGRYLYGSESDLALGGLPKDFAAAVSERTEAMSDAVPCDIGKRHILFGALIPGGGRIYAALSADTLQKACGESTYRGEGYSYVVEWDGDIMIPPVRYSYEQVYGDIESLLSDGGNDPTELKAFLTALAAGRAGSVVFFFDGQAQLICFDPLSSEKDWQFVTVVPVAAVEKDGAQIIQMSVYMTCIIVGTIAIALAAGVLFYIIMQRRQRENDRFLRSIYQAISENTDTVIFILDDKSSRLDYVFENSGRLLGIPYKEFSESELSGDSKLSDENGGKFRGKLLALLRDQRPESGCEQELHLYNDRLRQDMWLKVLICPFHMGEIPKHIYAVTDVTQEHNAREKITAAVAAAEQANAAKSSFLANMSHDMRTPMNGIVGMTAIAKKNLGDQERVQDCLNKIDLSSKHLLGLINDVLDMSRIESGKLALTCEPFDLTEETRGLVTMLHPQCEAKRQTLTLIPHIRHQKLLGDTVRLNQIFMNLLSNAVKFTPEGGKITVTIEELEQRHSDFAAYRFTVTDTGIGMSPAFMKVIFTPFERAGEAVVRQTEGTGLGMAITKNLVSAMGGQISVESEPGRGSSFIVELELPLQEPGQFEPAAEPDAPTGDYSYLGKRFLLAEDNAINREIAVELLQERGAQVEAVEDGRQAADQFLQSAPGYYDAVLMDIQMPVMNGYDAARAIRTSAHPKAKTIPIIAMTANAFAEDVKAAKDAGMNAHIAKPIDMEILHKTLEKCLCASQNEQKPVES